MDKNAPHVLYRFFGQDGALLYIGISHNIARRMGQHFDGKEWWQSVVGATFAHFPDRATAMAAEREAIRDEHPLHNIVHSPTRVWPSRSQPAVVNEPFVMGPDEWLIAEAYAELRQAESERRDALRQRDQALRAYADNHPEIPRKHIAQVVQRKLREAGWTDEEIVSVGASAATVRTSIERPRT